MIGKYLLAIAALVTSACSTAHECYPDIQLHVGGPRPEVDLTISGATKRVVFDTGATTTVVNIAEAENLGVAREGPLLPPFDRMHMASGYQGRLKNASIGAFQIASQSVPVMPVPLPTPAIISPYSFGTNILHLDLAGGILRICPRPDRPEMLGKAHGFSPAPFALPTVPVTIGGETVDAHLDTGSPVNLIFPMAFASTLKLEGELVQIGKALNHAFEKPIFKGKIAGTVRVGPLELIDPEVRFSDVVPRVNVGLGVLKQLQVTLDPANKRLWVNHARISDNPVRKTDAR
jgi:Aspartyl protease